MKARLSIFFLLLIVLSNCFAYRASQPYGPSIQNSYEKDFFPKVSQAGVQILVFGDSGSGKPIQMHIAKSMQKVCQKVRCDFGILLGDNFYEVGVSSVEDKQFEEKFEIPYSPLKIKFYPSLGNHDHGYFGLGGNITAQVAYTKKSEYWRMPHLYYNYKVQDVEFIVLDTNNLRDEDEKQLQWFQQTIQKSTAKWVIVYGHHPIYSYGSHGNNPGLAKNVLPQLCERADAYLAGHDHDLQLIQARCGFLQLVSGAAGKLRSTSSGPNSLFSKSAYGFNRVEILGDSMKILFYDKDGNELYQKEVKNRFLERK
ncbi:MAG: metallophosphoesterase [Spirochaetota bacterium]